MCDTMRLLKRDSVTHALEKTKVKAVEHTQGFKSGPHFTVALLCLISAALHPIDFMFELCSPIRVKLKS